MGSKLRTSFVVVTNKRRGRWGGGL